MKYIFILFMLAGSGAMGQMTKTPPKHCEYDSILVEITTDPPSFEWEYFVTDRDTYTKLTYDSIVFIPIHTNVGFTFWNGGKNYIDFIAKDSIMDVKRIIDSGSVSIMGDTTEAIRGLAHMYLKEHQRADSIKLLAERVLFSIAVDGSDTCAMRHLRKAMRAYNKLTGKHYYIGNDRPAACKLKKQPKCCKTLNTSFSLE